MSLFNPHATDFPCENPQPEQIVVNDEIKDIYKNLDTMITRAENIHIGGGSVDSVNGKTGVVVLTAEDINTVDGFDIQSGIDSLKANIINIDADIDDIKRDISTLDAGVSDLESTKQDKLVSGVSLKTINGEPLLGSGNIDVSGGGGTGAVNSVNGKTGNVVLSASDILRSDGETVETAIEINKYNIEEVRTIALDAEETAEDASVAVGQKQDKLVSGTNIKTINNESILGSGNITISGGGAVDSVNGKTGAVVLTASDVDAYDTDTVDTLLDTKADKTAVPAPATSLSFADTTAGAYGSSTRYARVDHAHPKSTIYVSSTWSTADSGKFLKINSSGNVVAETLPLYDGSVD